MSGEGFLSKAGVQSVSVWGWPLARARAQWERLGQAYLEAGGCRRAAARATRAARVKLETSDWRALGRWRCVVEGSGAGEEAAGTGHWARGRGRRQAGGGHATGGRQTADGRGQPAAEEEEERARARARMAGWRGRARALEMGLGK